MMNILIWSKNRACQLDLLLRSMEEYVDKEILDNSFITAICKDTNEKYHEGYAKLAQKNLRPVICYESDFRKDVLGAVFPQIPFTMILVDDNVFINPLKAGCAELEYLRNHNDAIAVSTRMHPGITYSYSNGIEMGVPEFEADPLRWRWKGLPADWGYPMCTGDGNIYRTDDILPLWKSTQFSNPYNIEQHCAENPIDRPYMICFNEAMVLGVPNNIVQTFYPNRHGDISAESLNEQWLDGYQISMHNFRGVKTNSPHKEIEYKMEAVQ